MNVIQADARSLPLANETVQCVVTSPPYWGLRDYKLEPLVWGGTEGCDHEWGKTNRSGQRQRSGAPGEIHEGRETNKLADNIMLHPPTGALCLACGAWCGSLGLEPRPELYVQHLVEIMREVRRVLRSDGTLWLNIGDSHANDGKWGGETGGKQSYLPDNDRQRVGRSKRLTGLKPKNLVGIPWRVAFALQTDGWYLRSDIIWAKGVSFRPDFSGSCMPESAKDRPTHGHEYLFLLTKRPRYYYDYKAVQEDGRYPAGTRAAKGSGTREGNRRGNAKHSAQEKNAAARRMVERIGPARDAGAPHGAGLGKMIVDDEGYATYGGKRNLRSVWAINPKPFKEAHFATFPPALVEPCIKAGSRQGDLVLDPFAGSGTVGLVAWHLGRRGVCLDLSREYCLLAKRAGPSLLWSK